LQSPCPDRPPRRPSKAAPPSRPDWPEGPTNRLGVDKRGSQKVQGRVQK
jgi:hypothetical protein